MKIVTLAARILLGLIFALFGLNGFLHFLPQPPLPPGLARDYFGVLTASHYFLVPYTLEFVSALLLLSNRYIPLALSLVAPVIVNILTFHVLMLPQAIGPGLAATICWLIVAYNVRSSFSGLFEPRKAG